MCIRASGVTFLGGFEELNPVTPKLAVIDILSSSVQISIHEVFLDQNLLLYLIYFIVFIHIIHIAPSKGWIGTHKYRAWTFPLVFTVITLLLLHLLASIFLYLVPFQC